MNEKDFKCRQDYLHAVIHRFTSAEDYYTIRKRKMDRYKACVHTQCIEPFQDWKNRTRKEEE